MADDTDTAPAPVQPQPAPPSAEDIAAARATIAAAAAAKPLPSAMAELCASDGFKAGFTALSEANATYPTEPSNDLAYAVMSMKRLMDRYGA